MKTKNKVRELPAKSPFDLIHVKSVQAFAIVRPSPDSTLRAERHPSQADKDECADALAAGGAGFQGGAIVGKVVANYSDNRNDSVVTAGIWIYDAEAHRAGVVPLGGTVIEDRAGSTPEVA